MTTPAETDPSIAEAIMAELINASESVRTAMYNSDLEVAWRPAVDRWNAAVQSAVSAFPAVETLLESGA